MATNLDIPSELVCEAQNLGHHATETAAVTAALEEYVRRRKQLPIFELVGKVEYDDDYDYKEDRRRSMKRLPK